LEGSQSIILLLSLGFTQELALPQRNLPRQGSKIYLTQRRQATVLIVKGKER